MGNRWFSDSDRITFILKHSYQINSRIKFLYSPTFNSPFYLQFYWDQNSLRLTKTTLQNKGNKTYLLLESGRIDLSEGRKLIAQIHAAKFPPFPLIHQPLLGRDGEGFELTILEEFSHATFSWWNVVTPKEWTVLDEIAEGILELDKKVNYIRKEFVHCTFLDEKDSSSNFKSLIWEIEDA